MRRKVLTAVGSGIFFGGCVSGPPTLTPAQELQASRVVVYRVGELPPQEYRTIESLSAADCSSAPAGGRVWGDAEQAINALKRKAAAIDADAVVNVSCSAVPLLNNCWAAQKCSGDAIKIPRADSN